MPPPPSIQLPKKVNSNYLPEQKTALHIQYSNPLLQVCTVKQGNIIFRRDRKQHEQCKETHTMRTALNAAKQYSSEGKLLCVQITYLLPRSLLLLQSRSHGISAVGLRSEKQAECASRRK